MSGITPILDTLLHQVLGRRVDIPLPRSTPEPVRPAEAGGLVPAVRSDSRTDPRAPLSGLAGAGERSRSEAAPARAGAAEPGSVRTHFSVAARAIADLLLRYPAPPSAIRPAAPLLAPDDGGGAEGVARQLRASVERSGLFYESHLGSWFRGGFSGDRLAREPQMTLTRSPLTASAPRGPAPGAGQVNSGPTSPAPAVPQDAGEGAGRPGVRGAIDAAAGESLQALLRHQLEMLAAPVLRWEGEVWPGIAMALLVQAPPESPQRGKPREEHEGDREPQREEDVWHSRLTLRLAGLGDIGVRLQLRGEYLELFFDAPSGEVAERLDDAGERLRGRLRAGGFREVLLRVETSG